jgi:hypothetical protein
VGSVGEIEPQRRCTRFDERPQDLWIVGRRTDRGDNFGSTLGVFIGHGLLSKNAYQPWDQMQTKAIRNLSWSGNASTLRPRNLSPCEIEFQR